MIRRPAHLRRNVRVRFGFTFIELLFAVAIFGIGLIGLASMLMVSNIQIARTEQAVQSISSCRSGVESIRAQIINNPGAGFEQAEWSDTRRLGALIDPAHPLVRTLGDRVDRTRERAWIPFYVRQRRNGTLQPASIVCVGIHPVAETPWSMTQWNTFMGITKEGNVAAPNDNPPLPITIGPNVEVDDLGQVSIQLLPYNDPRGNAPEMIQQAAVEKGLILVSDPDPVVSGRILRLNKSVTINGQPYWTLTDTSDLPADTRLATFLANRRAYLIGCGLLNPQSGQWDAITNPFVGPSLVESFHAETLVAR